MKRKHTTSDVLLLGVWLCAYAVIVRVFRMMRWFESNRGARGDVKGEA
jgi:hypothetical protein